MERRTGVLGSRRRYPRNRMNFSPRSVTLPRARPAVPVAFSFSSRRGSSRTGDQPVIKGPCRLDCANGEPLSPSEEKNRPALRSLPFPAAYPPCFFLCLPSSSSFSFLPATSSGKNISSEPKIRRRIAKSRVQQPRFRMDPGPTVIPLRAGGSLILPPSPRDSRHSF